MAEADQKIIRVGILMPIMAIAGFGPIFLAGLTSLYHHYDPPWVGTLLCISYPLVIYASCTLAVILESGTIIYRTLFWERRMDLTTVTDVRIVARPYAALELSVAGERKKKPFTFILWPFRRDEVKGVMHYVRQYAPYARFDKMSNDLLGGDFKAVDRTTAKRFLFQSVLVEGVLSHVVQMTVGAGIIAAIVRYFSHH